MCLYMAPWVWVEQTPHASVLPNVRSSNWAIAGFLAPHQGIEPCYPLINSQAHAPCSGSVEFIKSVVPGTGLEPV